MSVAHADDADDYGRPAGETNHVEKSLPNGDLYTGQWRGGRPNGHGKYIWSDGYMYVGDWYKGKTMGKGLFSWSNGATYEGDFKNGYMDGKGSYIGPAGDAYRGSWVMNLRHGQGTKKNGDGSCYEGEWRRGLQDGHGRYVWKNGNHYIGQWKNGSINGNETMIWSNWNRFDGHWEDGMPKGNGTFRWADGSFYVGVWSEDPKEQNGTYYPSSGSPIGNLDWNPQQVFREDLNECGVTHSERISVFPSQKMPNWSGMEGNGVGVGGGRTRMRKTVDVDGRKSNVELEVRKGEDGSEMGNGKLSPLRILPAKRQGLTISKGHKNYELMLNLQLGIRHSVGRPAPSTSLDLKASAFDPKEKVWTKFPPEGSKHTPPHQSCEFKWKDYCPVVFRTLRKLFGVDPADYMISICGNDALRELSSPGKSGSFFYLTNDDRYMIKTLKKAEAKVLIRMLPAYYNHVRACENTLVTRFFGLHCVKLTSTAQKKVRFVIMGNLFCSEFPIHRRFDLKGSSHGRLTAKPEPEIDPSTTLKDLDLNFIFRLQKSWFHEFCRQVDRDSEFLEQERIMDYSLLVGLHFRQAADSMTPTGTQTPTENPDGGIPRVSRTEMDEMLLDVTRLASIKLGINMPARVERTTRSTDGETETQLVGDPTGEIYDVMLFFGIIDILQDYDISKKLEHAYKSMHHDPTSISAVDPKQYSKRFREFIFKVFVEDT